MTHHVRSGVVADTGVISELIYRDNQRPPSAWLQTVLPHITGKSIYCSHITVAEMMAAAKQSGAIEGRIDVLRGQIGLLRVEWPSMDIVERYSDLEASLPNDHRLAAKAAEADRWIAATALVLNLPVISNDNAYAKVPGLQHIYVPPLSNKAAAKALANGAPSTAGS